MNGLPSNPSSKNSIDTNFSIETQKELAQKILNEIKPLQDLIKTKREELLNLNLDSGLKKGLDKERKIEQLNLEVNDLQAEINQKIDQVKKIIEKL